MIYNCIFSRNKLLKTLHKYMRLFYGNAKYCFIFFCHLQPVYYIEEFDLKRRCIFFMLALFRTRLYSYTNIFPFKETSNKKLSVFNIF